MLFLQAKTVTFQLKIKLFCIHTIFYTPGPLEMSDFSDDSNIYKIIQSRDIHCLNTILNYYIIFDSIQFYSIL